MFLMKKLIDLLFQKKMSYARVPFCSGKVFEGVHSYVMDFVRKSDFAPDNFSSKTMITILFHSVRNANCTNS